MITNEAQALRLAEELQQLRALAANPQWVEFQKLIAKAEKRATEGLRERGVTPEKRAEHVEASFLADELGQWFKNKEESIRTALENWRRSKDEVDARLLDN